MEKLNEKLLTFNPFKNVTNILIIVLLCTFLFWYVRYHWKRRRLYKMAAKINGPYALPFLGNALHTAGPACDILKNICRLCTQYKSPIRVWFGTQLNFGIRKPEDTQIILNNALQKDDLYKYAQYLGGNGLFTAPVATWKKHKKMIMPAFNQKILDGFVVTFAEQSGILVEQLRKVSGKGIFDIFDYVNRCTLDIICATAMGVNVNAQTTDCEYMKWVTKALEATYTRMFNIWYQFDFIYQRTKLSKEEKYVVDKIHQFTETIVRKRREAHKNCNRWDAASYGREASLRRNSFLQQLIELSEKGGEITDKEIMEEVDTFMVAGSDTTAGTISFVLLVLGMYPDIQKKVYQEITKVVGQNETIEYQDLVKMAYLERVLKETLRIFPIGPLLARAVTQDIQLENCVLPAGSSVTLVIILLHRDPELWPNPLKFDPDRFLPEEVAKRHPYSWVPFSAGPRNCVGAKYAMMVMKTIIASLIRKYTFFTDYNRIEDVELKAELTLKPCNGFKVSIEFRD